MGAIAIGMGALAGGVVGAGAAAFAGAPWWAGALAGYLVGITASVRYASR